MVSDHFSKHMSVQEYLTYEQETGIKHEYIDGEIFAREGRSDTHSTIALNCGGELRTHLRNKPCRAFNSDMKIKITDIKYFTLIFRWFVAKQNLLMKSARCSLIQLSLPKLYRPQQVIMIEVQKLISTVVCPQLKPISCLTKNAPLHNSIPVMKAVGSYANFQAWIASFP